MTITAPTRRRAPILVGVLAGAVLAVAAPLAASAHVHVTPENAAAGATSTLTFSFSHGCDDSPTTALVVDIPEGVTHVVPVFDAGWTIASEVAGNGAITRVTFTAATPIDNGVKGEVRLDARFAEELADSEVPFPVTQQCVVGETAWIDVAADGEEEPESPAPLVAVGAVAAEAEHGHSDSESTGLDAAASSETADASAPADPTALWIGGAGLGLGALALVVAITALVRRRA